MYAAPRLRAVAQSRCHRRVGRRKFAHPRSQCARLSRVEGVAKAIAQQIDRQHGDGQESAGNQDQISGDQEKRSALGNDVSPTWGRWRSSSPEETENGFNDNRGGAYV